jgi:DNA-binding response OmpR family regulator
VSIADPTLPSVAGAGEPDPTTILLAEADATLAAELLEQMRADGYRVVLARSAEHARVLARAQPIRAILLGWLDDVRAALDLLEEIRGAATPTGDSTWDAGTPVIVLSPVTAQLDLLRAFELGADDFLARGPHSYLELRARLKAVLRRTERTAGTRLFAGALEVDTSARLVRVGDTPIELCRLEYELLVHLARDPSRVYTKQELLRAIWRQHTLTGARTVDSHASRLRRKLEVAGAPGLVVNVWGVGYRLL